MGLWRENFHPAVLLRWNVLAAFVFGLPTIAGVFLVFDQFGWANACFMLTAAFIFGKIAQLAITSSDPVWHRLLFTFLLFGAAGIGIVETVRSVNAYALRRREHAFSGGMHPAATSSAAATNNEPTYLRAETPRPQPTNAKIPPAPARAYPDVTATLRDAKTGVVQLTLVNNTGRNLDAVKITVREHFHRCDEKSFKHAVFDSPTFQFTHVSTSAPIPIKTIQLEEEAEDACVLNTVSDVGTFHYTFHFRKVSDKWEQWCVVTNEHQKVIEERGVEEDPRRKRKRVRRGLSLLLQGGGVLQMNLEVALGMWSAPRNNDEAWNESLRVMEWHNELVCYLSKNLDEGYVARVMINKAQIDNYPAAVDASPDPAVVSSCRWAWRALQTDKAKIEEFLKELPEL